jgi:pimeloyl-ACP methyl ester carboxylesterase
MLVSDMIGAPSKTLQLQNGGRIVMDEYGDPSGQPVFFCHGWPSSRMMGVLTDEAARDLGLRILSPDRPGVNESTFQKDRTLLHWPSLLNELADQLGIGKFRVLGISGGAPYALASAWALPERIRVVAVVSGAPPISELEKHDGLLGLYRWMLALYRHRPELLRTCFHVARPFARRRIPLQLRPMFLKLLQPCDAAVLRDSAAFEACFESQRRAWRASAEGVMIDAEIYARPWGFRLEDVKTPVRLWHGKTDRSFSYRLAEQIAQRLPNCRAHFVEAAGHYSLPIRHMHEILVDLKSM